MRVNQLNRKWEPKQLLCNLQRDIELLSQGSIHMTNLPYLQSPLNQTGFSNTRNSALFPTRNTISCFQQTRHRHPQKVKWLTYNRVCHSHAILLPSWGALNSHMENSAIQTKTPSIWGSLLIFLASILITHLPKTGHSSLSSLRYLAH